MGVSLSHPLDTTLIGGFLFSFFLLTMFLLPGAPPLSWAGFGLSSPDPGYVLGTKKPQVL